MERNYKYMVADFRLMRGSKGWFFGKKAMISCLNIYQIFEDEPWVHKLFFSGTLLEVEVAGIPLRGKLVREQGNDGVFYNLRFVDVSEENKQELAQKVSQSGIHPPWHRSARRIHLGIASQRDQPLSVIFPRTVGQVLGEVVNFSRSGMLFEFLTTGLSVGEYVDQKIRFQICLQSGKIIPNCEARIARIYDEPRGAGRVLRGLGLHKLDMGKSGFQENYKQLVLGLEVDQIPDLNPAPLEK